MNDREFPPQQKWFMNQARPSKRCEISFSALWKMYSLDKGGTFLFLTRMHTGKLFRLKLCLHLTFNRLHFSISGGTAKWLSCFVKIWLLEGLRGGSWRYGNCYAIILWVNAGKRNTFVERVQKSCSSGRKSFVNTDGSLFIRHPLMFSWLVFLLVNLEVFSTLLAHVFVTWWDETDHSNV